MSQRNYLIPDWDAPNNIHAAMTLRTGGVSTKTYASLNPATHVDDNNQSVMENRLRIKHALGLPTNPAWLNQIHSSNVIEINKQTHQLKLINADASFTTQSKVVCAILTADCLPLIFATQDGQKIAAIHAGWRGLLDGIIKKTILALKTTEITVWLGAAIGRCCFEVGGEVRDLFIAKHPPFAEAFNAQSSTKYLVDIYQLARIELALNNVHQIYGGNFCTVCDAQKFFSYRRDKQTGRMATLIWKD